MLQGYLPAQLYNLNSCYGNKEQLQSLTWALNHAGIKPVADIVINHRCADAQNAAGVWNNYRYSHSPLLSEWFQCSMNPSNMLRSAFAAMPWCMQPLLRVRVSFIR